MKKPAPEINVKFGARGKKKASPSKSPKPKQ